LAITTDNASNNSTFMDFLANMLTSESIDFEPKNQWMRCLVYIINLTVQSTLASLRAVEASSEDDILENIDKTTNGTITTITSVISKVRVMI
jgi:hypothetical protein